MGRWTDGWTDLKKEISYLNICIRVLFSIIIFPVVGNATPYFILFLYPDKILDITHYFK